MKYPILAAGQRLTALTLQQMTDDYTIKAANTARASTITTSPDPELSAIALTVGTFFIEFNGLMTGVGGASVGGFQNVWTFTGVATGQRSTMGMGFGSTTGNTGTIMRTSGASIASTGQTYGVGANTTAMRETAIVTVTTAGNLSIDWAQGASNATATTLLAGSYLKYKQIG
jgi:hypothetical protein